MTEVERPVDLVDNSQKVAMDGITVEIDLSSPTTDSGVGTSENSPTEHTAPQPSEEKTFTPEPEPEPVTTEPVAETMSQSASDPTPVAKAKTQPSEYQNGPDQVVPADSLMTWDSDGAVKLRITDSGAASRKPISVSTMMEQTVKKAPESLAMAVKRDNEWVKWTYKQYYDDVVRAAKSFIKCGLEPYHGVGIIGFNSPEWFISDLGAIFAGGFCVGIYTTNSPEACQYVADNSQSNIIVVENNAQLQKILKVRDQLPHLKAIIQYSGQLTVKTDNVYTWSEFMEMGKDVPDSVLQARIQAQAANKCCTLIYTSGTTGNPKGVMLSHDNLTWTALVAGEAGNLKFGEEILISYLPLSHIAAQIVDIYAPIAYGAQIWFAQPDALKGSLATTMKEVRPTAFLGVPRVWEKMQEKMLAIGKSVTGIKRKLADWAKDVSLRGNMSLMNGLHNGRKKKRGSTPFGWSMSGMLLKKVRVGLGLDRCRFCMSAAAPMMKDTLEYFMSLNIVVTEMYGMSESTGPHTVSFPWAYRLGTVGKEIPGVATKLDNMDDEGNGEICMGGRHVFMGYVNQEEKTKETIDAEGWLHTGDVGKKDKHGFLSITGRIKELIITAGGENVAPVPIEDTVKVELPVVSNCMLIGDKKKFLAILLTLKTQVDEETSMPIDNLSAPALDWCKSIGSNATTLTEIVDHKDEKVLKAIQEGIDRTNKKAVSRAQNIQKWSILPQDFSIPGGELGPTMKLKRPVVTKMYHNTIEAFYGDS